MLIGLACCLVSVLIFNDLFLYCMIKGKYKSSYLLWSSCLRLLLSSAVYNPAIDKPSPDRHVGEPGREKRLRKKTRTAGNVMAVRPNHPSSVFSLLASTNSGGPATRLTFLNYSQLAAQKG